MFGLSPEEMGKLGDEELQSLNDKMIFVRDAMPGEWLSLAEELRDAAEVLWHDRSNGFRAEWSQVLEVVDGKPRTRGVMRKVYANSRPYVLLAGFALENLLKGLLVAGDPSHVTSGELSKQLITHKLLVLVDLLQPLPMNENEKRFCEIAQDAIPYWGRYPVPRAHSRVKPEVGLDHDLHSAFLQLFDRLSQRLHKQIKDGWDSGVGAKSGKTRSARHGDDIKGDEPLWE